MHFNLLTHKVGPAGRTGFASILVLCALAATGRTAHAQNPTIFDDEFNGTSLDLSQWSVYKPGYFVERTEFGLAPAIRTDSDGTSYLRIPLNTYDSDTANSGTDLQGCEVQSLHNFNVGAGLEYEARIRSNNLPPGLVLGFFPYGGEGVWTSTYKQTEIDYELLTTQGGNAFWTNIWDDWNPDRGGPNSAQLTSDSGLNWNNGTWNDYKVDWYPDHTNWIVNGTIVRTETTVQPGDPMGLTLNLWGASSGWGTAYSSSLVAQKTLAANQSYYFDVDYVRVRPITSTSTAVIGTGTGLTGAYYPNMTISGTPSTIELDPRINFNWGDYPLVPTVPATVTSAKWTGFIEPQYSQTYTITTTSDDGSRVYINGKEVVNNWYNQSATSRSGTISLTAGKLYPIEVDYYQNTGVASMQLLWSCKSTAKCLVPQSQLYPAAQPAAPTFSVGTGTYAQRQTVAITSATAGSTIYYTLDGSTPSTSSSSVANGGSVLIPTSSLLSAIAVVSGEVPSSATYAYYTYANSVKPAVTVVNPANNALATSLSAVNGTASEAAGGIGISYVNAVIEQNSTSLTWNGSAWVSQQYGLSTTLSNGTWTYAGALPSGSNLPNGAYTVKGVAYDYTGSDTVATNNLTINSTVPAAPVFSVPGGTYSQFQTVTITSSSSGATIYYTTNGTVPTTASASLANGGSLLVKPAETLSAIAVVTGEVPSAVTTAGYVYVNSVKPVVAVTAPANGAALQALTSISGTASEAANGIGLSYVQVVITQVSTGYCWNGSSWINAQWGLSTSLSGGTWICTGTLPSGTNIPDGSYTIKAVAVDYLNNVTVATNSIIIDTLSPAVAITLPATGSTLSTWNSVTGTAADRDNGSGLSHVDLVITRVSDGTEWNGWVWLTTPTGIPTSLSGGNFSAVNTTVPGIPTASNLEAGAYTVKAVAYDMAGNANAVTVSITISAGGTVESAKVISSGHSS